MQSSYNGQAVEGPFKKSYASVVAASSSSSQPEPEATAPLPAPIQRPIAKPNEITHTLGVIPFPPVLSQPPPPIGLPPRKSGTTPLPIGPPPSRFSVPPPPFVQLPPSFAIPPPPIDLPRPPIAFPPPPIDLPPQPTCPPTSSISQMLESFDIALQMFDQLPSQSEEPRRSCSLPLYQRGKLRDFDTSHLLGHPRQYNLPPATGPPPPPQQAVQQKVFVQQASPHRVYLQQGFVQQTFVQQDAPQQGYSQEGVLQQGLINQVFPQQILINQNFPQQGFPQQSNLPQPPNIPANAGNEIQDVWVQNLHEEFQNIRKIVQKYRWVAMDTEFPGVVASVEDSTDPGRPVCLYQQLRVNVELLRLIQLGITFMDEHGNTPPGTSTWQFNFKFNLSVDKYAQDSIELLQQCGLQFGRHEVDGIDRKEFAELLTTSGLILIEDITWLSFHAGFDFAFLFKILSNSSLPLDEDEFLATLKLYFPNIYDVKHLMKKCKNLRGGLQEVANQLDLKRIGKQHHAGSDAHLTGLAFFKIKEIFFDHTIENSNGQIYGLNPPPPPRTVEKAEPEVPSTSTDVVAPSYINYLQLPPWYCACELCYCGPHVPLVCVYATDSEEGASTVQYLAPLYWTPYVLPPQLYSE